MTPLRLALRLALVLTSPSGGLAQTTPPAPTAPSLGPGGALQRVFGAEALQPEWFSAAFSTLLPQIQEAVTTFRRQFGALLRVDGTAGTYRLTYERGAVTVRAETNSAGILIGLLILDSAPLQSDPAVLSALRRLFSVSALDPAWFAPAFLAQLPAAQLQSLLAQTTDGLGAFRDVDYRGGYRLIFGRAAVPVRSVALDASGRFSTLLLGPPQSTAAPTSVEEVVTALQALPGQISLTVTQQTPAGPKEVASLAPDARLAVGSAFKLAVLAEVQAQVRAGQLSWDAQVTLQDADRSLPSGTLQNDPSGTRYTVQALAEAMISVSDNTAADLLLRTVGRSGVEARLGEAPMLNTRELFALRNPANAALLARFRAATSGPQKRAVLAAADVAPLPAPDQLLPGLDAEWHVSVRQLCALMNEVAALPLTTLNPGVARPEDFTRVSYKGGSDLGVLNLTTQVVTKAGQTSCVSVSWNDARPVSLNRLSLLVQDLLGLLSR